MSRVSSFFSHIIFCTLACDRFMKKQFHLKVWWVERGFSVVKGPQASPRQQYSPSWATRRLDTGAPGTQPCTCGWASWYRPPRRRLAALGCSPRKPQYEWTSPRSEGSLHHCAMQRRCVRSTGDTRRSCFPWCCSCSHCPCGRCSCRSVLRACLHRWCLSQSSAGPSKSSLQPGPVASSQSARVGPGTDAAREWCWSPSGSPRSGGGTCEPCQRQNSAG